MPRNPAALADVLDLTRRRLPQALVAQGVMSPDVVSGGEKLALVRQRVAEIGGRAWTTADANAVAVELARKAGAKRVLRDMERPDPDLDKALRDAGFKVIYLDADGEIQAQAPRRARQRNH